MVERVAIVGFGVTGQSVARHLLKEQAELVVLDTREPIANLSDELSHVDVRWRANALPDEPFDRVIVSPGLSMDSCLMRSALTSALAIQSDIDVFFAAAQAPVIGITGTNGKSTVTSLVGHMLQGHGQNVGMGGNLGEAALDLLDDSRDAYVLELSSFQLERSMHQPFSVAAILNVSEDHIDQHGSFERYCAAKQRIYAQATKTISNRDDVATGSGDVSFGLSEPANAAQWGLIVREGATYIGVGKEAVVDVAALPISGTHNVLNVMAACALVDGAVPRTEMAALLEGFQGLAHRFETVGSINGVTFIDDSKATNVGATVAALNGIDADQNVVLIAGGDAKGADLAPLKATFRSKVKAVVTIGVDGHKIATAAEQAGVETHPATTLENAVSQANALASKGGLVLLSPACASLDMFANYIERGRQFSRAVRALEEVKS